MKLEEKTLRMGAAAVLIAVVLRIFAAADFGYLFSGDGFVSVMTFLGTGRWVQNVQLPETQIPSFIPEEPVQAVFSLQELDAISLHNPNGYTADLQSALCTPLSWQLANGQPAVLILHSHASEAFSGCAGWRSENTAYNMVSIGDRVGALLEQAGIQVIHDRSLHDSPSYDAAYGNSRTSIESYLTQYPSIRLVLDLHRDASENSSGQQIGYTTDYNGQDAATMMLVVSAYDYGGNAAWQRNLSFATKLQLQLEQLSPGICRPLVLRSYHYNQDICPTGLLIEMGFAGNEQEEVLRSAEALAEAIIALQNGSEVITAVSAE